MLLFALDHWKFFLTSNCGNWASAFGQYSEARSRGSSRPHVRSYWAKFMADCGSRCRAEERPWPPTVRPERSKNQSAVRPARASRAAPECLGSPQYLVVSIKRSAIVCRSSLRCKAHRLKLGASSRPRSHANQDVAFCADQVLRSHTLLRYRVPSSSLCRGPHQPPLSQLIGGLPFGFWVSDRCGYRGTSDFR